MRWLTGFWMLGALLTSAGLFIAHDIPLYDGLFYAQLAFYALALIGFAFDGTRVARFPLFALPMSICVVAVAFSRGFLEVLAGRKEDLWTPVGVKSVGE